MQNLSPIALFVYNRPEHTRRTIKFLKENLLADESRLFIFSDGPANSKEVEKVNEVREVIKSADGFKKIEIVERSENAGLANSIIEGVTKLVKEYGKVIVFEDDLITSPYTLKYFNDALCEYQNASKVMHIGAYMYPLKAENLPETFFYRAATSWGWATWDRAWKSFEPDIDILMKQFDAHKRFKFSIEGTMNFWRQMQEFKTGRNNSWAIRWYASIFLKNGLTLNPSHSMVNNIGHDGSGVHSGLNDIYNVVINPKPISYFPDQLHENAEAFAAIKIFLQNRKGTLTQRIIRFIKGKLHR
ncbi:MAG: sugar transferase [Daejeonella sp.]|nr:sugar transferase [Daejeonella sp.]